MANSPAPPRKPGRPPAQPDRALILEAARLFYNGEDGKGMKREEVARKMRIQPRRVSVLLDQAREFGIVRIVFAENDATELDLEKRLRAKYPHLQRAIIVAPGPYEELPKRWAVAAADYFEHLYNTRSPGKPLHVAVTGNETLMAFANAVPDQRREDLYVHVIGLIGQALLPKHGRSQLNSPQSVATTLWNRSGGIKGQLEFCTVSPYYSERGPGPAGRQAVKTEIRKVERNPAIREVVERLNDLDIIFGGIGIVNPKGVNQSMRDRVTMESLLYNVVTPEELEQEGALGDYAYCTFGPTGRQQKRWRFFLTAGHYTEHWGVEFFRHIAATPGKIVAAFAAMPQLPAIRVALGTEIINVLITETNTAEKLLEES